MKIVAKIILAPLIAVLFLCMAVVMAPVWLLGHIPVIGPWIFIGGLYLLSPFFISAQYLGFTWVSFEREQLVFREDGLVIAKGKKKRHLMIADIVEIRERFNPPCLVTSIMCSSGSVIELNPFTDTEELINWSRKSGVTVRQWQNKSCEATGDNVSS